MTDMELIKLAEEAGFRAAVIPAKEIPVDGSFRKFCEDNRLVSAILLLKFLHFVNSGLNGQAYIVVKIYEKTRVTIHKEKASATSPKQCRIGKGQP